MSERVVVHQNSKFETIFMVQDPQSAEGAQLMTVERIHLLTPYGMLLAGLGGCTAMVMHTYAQHHNISLDEIEITLEYARVFKEDCENCDKITAYDEAISEKIVLNGKLTDEEVHRLMHVSHQCPISRMMEDGIQITTTLEGRAEIREAGKGLEGR